MYYPVDIVYWRWGSGVGVWVGDCDGGGGITQLLAASGHISLRFSYSRLVPVCMKFKIHHTRLSGHIGPVSTDQKRSLTLAILQRRGNWMSTLAASTTDLKQGEGQLDSVCVDNWPGRRRSNIQKGEIPDKAEFFSDSRIPILRPLQSQAKVVFFQFFFRSSSSLFCRRPM